MTLNPYFEKVTEETIRADLMPFVPDGSILKNYALATSLPSQRLTFLTGPFAALNLHIFSLGITDHREFIIYDRISKQSRVLSPKSVTWIRWKKHWLNNTLTIALLDHTRIGFMLPHRSALLPNQTSQLEALHFELASFPQKPLTHIHMISWLKVFGVSFLLSGLSLIPLLFIRFLSRSNALFWAVMMTTLLTVFVFANKLFKYSPKITSAIAGASYGIFFGVSASLGSSSFASGLTFILLFCVLGLLFGYVFGFIYGLITKQDYYQDFSN